jgi:adenylate kinase family enzyme
MPSPYQRVNVVGTSGSGKTTFARELARRLGSPHIEMDALYHGPNWSEPPLEVFRERIRQVVSEDRWIIDGNYSKARDIVWSRADTVIWLDLPMPIVLWRIGWRSLRRAITRENLWGSGNRETLKQQFLSRDSLLLWVIQTHGRRKREFPELFQKPENSHLRFIRLQSPQAAQRWLEESGI